MVNKLDSLIAFQRQTLNLRAERQQVLAANIANADTPNYKARDFDFRGALGDAVAGRSRGNLQLAKTDDRHLSGMATDSTARLQYRTETQGSVDGNTVNMDTERAHFADNAMHYQAALTFLTRQFQSMETAMQTASR